MTTGWWKWVLLERDPGGKRTGEVERERASAWAFSRQAGEQKADEDGTMASDLRGGGGGISTTTL